MKRAYTDAELLAMDPRTTGPVGPGIVRHLQTALRAALKREATAKRKLEMLKGAGRATDNPREET